MDVKAVMKNLKKKGFRETLKIRRKNVELRRLLEEYRIVLNRYKDAAEREDEKKLQEALCSLLEEYRYAFQKRPFMGVSTSQYKEFMGTLFSVQQILDEQMHREYRELLKEIKATYIKERIPLEYREHAIGPVEQKVISMENGNSPSPSAHHLSQVMKAQGEYSLKFMGLKIRSVSEIEYYENALRFVRELATAKAVFLSTANDILSHFDVRPETKVIQLWHGVGVFKKVGYSTVDNPHFGKGVKERQEYDQYRNYSYVTIPAEEQAWIFEDAFRIRRDAGIIVPIGVSRTDVFFDQEYIDAAYKRLYEALPQIRGRKIILYAPTFRGSTDKGKAPDQLDINAFGEALSDDYVLLIKHHGLAKNVPEIPEKWRDNFAFDMGKRKILGIERLLAIADICVTDYSSIAFEYAILERPLIFFAYDLDEYLDRRGMYYDYEEITPGPVCRTNDEMIDYILHIAERFNKQEILDFKQKYVNMCDGHATERTIELIEK